MPKLGVVTEWVCDVCKKKGSAHGDALPKWYGKEWAVLNNPDDPSDTLALCGRCAQRTRAIFGWLLGGIIPYDVALDIIERNCKAPNRYSWKSRVIGEILWLQSFIAYPDDDRAFCMTLVPLVMMRRNEPFAVRFESFEQMVEYRRASDEKIAGATESCRRTMIGTLLPEPAKLEIGIPACCDCEKEQPEA